MSSKKTTTTTAQYDPTSMAFFRTLTPQLQKSIGADLNIDPTQSPVFNLALQYAMKAVQGANQTATNSQMSRLNAFGAGSNMSGMKTSLLGRLARYQSGNASNAFLTNFINYDTLRRQETMNAMNYKPLQTGQTTEEKKSGGWLAPLVGAIGSIALAPFTRGASLAALPGLGKSVFDGGSVGANGDEQLGINTAMNIPNLSNANPLSSLNMKLPSSYFNNYTRF